MPLIHMYFEECSLTNKQKVELSRKVTDLLVREAKKPCYSICVIIHEVPAENWMINRSTLLELKFKKKVGKNKKMTHAEEIIKAVAVLVKKEGKTKFSRKEIRERIGLSQNKWMSGYTSIFQGMRSDHPGGAPQVRSQFKGVFRQVRHAIYTITDYGKQLINKFNC